MYHSAVSFLYTTPGNSIIIIKAVSKSFFCFLYYLHSKNRSVFYPLTMNHTTICSMNHTLFKGCVAEVWNAYFVNLPSTLRTHQSQVSIYEESFHWYIIAVAD